MLVIGRVEDRVFSRVFKVRSRACAYLQSAGVYLFVFLPRARPRNQSQSAEVALAWNCVVSVSHISGVAAAATDAKKREAERNKISSIANAERERKKEIAHTQTRTYKRRPNYSV